MNDAKPPSIRLGIYEHYKGKKYEALGVAQHSETLEWFVVYKKLYDDGGLWVRPHAIFIEHVVVDGVTRPRFRFVQRETIETVTQNNK